MSRRVFLALGLALGAASDAVLPDPARGHPVALFGQWAAAHEREVYADSAIEGAGFLLSTVTPVWLLGRRISRAYRDRPGARLLATAGAGWLVLGGAGLRRAAGEVEAALTAGDLDRARQGLRSLCARDSSALTAEEVARAAVESVAENTSDAVVAPLLWGAVAGLPGLLAYRAVNTLDAMIGYRNARYERFGKPAARLDDAANYVPSRVTAALACVLAPTVRGSRRAAYRTWLCDGARHPSPNAGPCEAAFAGALGVQLGGTNTYDGQVDERGLLGEGAPPTAADIGRAIRLSEAVSRAAVAVAMVVALRRHRR